MAGTEEPTGREAGGKLAAAIRRVREMQADRGDVVVEMQHAGRARLELLAQELEPLVRELPEDATGFDFALSAGETPRLWIDMVAHVRLGRDRRVYEFVKDTGRGRIVLAASADRDEIAARVADYVAERLIERRQVIEGDRARDAEWLAQAARRDRQTTGWLAAGLFAAGMLAGAAAMLLWAWLAA